MWGRGAWLHSASAHRQQPPAAQTRHVESGVKTSSDLFVKIVDARVAARSAAEPRQRRQQVEAVRVLLGNKGFLLVSGFGHPGSYLAICGVDPSISYGIISGTDDLRQVLFHSLSVFHIESQRSINTRSVHPSSTLTANSHSLENTF